MSPSLAASSTAGRASDERVLVLDFGSQYAQLIARRVREQNVYCEIVRHDISADRVRAHRPRGLILSGGPNSVYEAGAPRCDPQLLQLGIPVLGICYGMQLVCEILGGQVNNAPSREYGRSRCQITSHHDLFAGVAAETVVWMSHGDQVFGVSADFLPLARTETCPIAAVRHQSLPVFGLQFHPEVTHTPQGSTILHNFLTIVCGCEGTWHLGDFARETILRVREQVGEARVICGLSGGVDSAVTAALLYKAIGPQLSCILVDNGLLRKAEQQAVLAEFSSHFQTDLHVIESGAAPDGPAATIKLHHNVGGLPAELGFELIEPLRELFKDEVRQLGKELGLPDDVVWRHPFPGPGLAVRCLGEVSRHRLNILREADAIVVEEIKAAGLYRNTAQAFAVLLPVQSVGVMGDARTYEDAVAVRCVNSDDFMTADWSHLPYELLARISTRIINEVRGVNRVCYDISSKPPATIEWE